MLLPKRFHYFSRTEPWNANQSLFSFSKLEKGQKTGSSHDKVTMFQKLYLHTIVNDYLLLQTIYYAQCKDDVQLYVISQFGSELASETALRLIKETE